MLSKPYPSKGTATSAAKDFAIENGINKISIAVDITTRKFHFTDEKDIDKNQIIFSRMELKRGKWKDKPLIKDKAARRGASHNG